MTDNSSTDQVAVLRSMMAEGYGGHHFCEEVEKGCQEIERLRRYANLLETAKGAIEEQAEEWRLKLMELQGHV